MVIHEDPNPARLFEDCRGVQSEDIVRAYHEAADEIEWHRAAARAERRKRIRNGFMEVIAVIGGTIAWGCMIAAAL